MRNTCFLFRQQHLQSASNTRALFEALFLKHEDIWGNLCMSCMLGNECCFSRV